MRKSLSEILQRNKTKKIVRVGATVFLLSAVLFMGFQAVTTDVKSVQEEYQEAYQSGSDEQVVPPADGMTAVISDRTFRGGIASALIIFDADGTVFYYNGSFTNYQDVDPIAGENDSVVYLAAERLSEAECASNRRCSLMVLERLNLTTKETTRLWGRRTYSEKPDRRSPQEYHDFARINDSHYAIGDIGKDRVFIVDVKTGLTVWSWDAISDYDPSSGGPYPADWTHLNDVEVLQNGTIMTSLRNQDQVVFIDRRTGLKPNLTLGEDDNHEILYEQHNPDYIPPEDGGPAIIVADSENRRVIEYQREAGEWNRTWIWQSSDMKWPRDGDRLPSGNTLISDSHGNRLIEVNESGAIVWSAPVSNPYEAERLGTGPESTNGQSAKALGLESLRGVAPSKSTSLRFKILSAIASPLPNKFLNGLLFVLPAWATQNTIVLLILMPVVVALWAVLEAIWHPYTVEVRWPIRVNR